MTKVAAAGKNSYAIPEDAYLKLEEIVGDKSSVFYFLSQSLLFENVQHTGTSGERTYTVSW